MKPEEGEPRGGDGRSGVPLFEKIRNGTKENLIRILRPVT
jgi:hypothetical protein